MGAEAFPTAVPFLPIDRSLSSLQTAVQACRGCVLYETATQAVFGEAPTHPDWMFVGEQPGDQEDRQGWPFVGPAGGMLDKAMAELGIVRDRVYVTNAVKHFRWTPKGKRRIHQTPRASEQRACLPWLEAEMEAVKPRLIACLGATAVAAVLGSSVKVMVNRGRVIEGAFGPCLVTVHPSSLLRIQYTGDRQAAFDAFLYDLRQGIEFLTRAG